MNRHSHGIGHPMWCDSKRETIRNTKQNKTLAAREWAPVWQGGYGAEAAMGLYCFSPRSNAPPLEPQQKGGIAYQALHIELGP